MVSPRTRGIRGRGTRLKRLALKTGSGGLIAIICTLFTIGLTLDSIAFSSIISGPFNLLSIIGMVTGTIAILAALKFWSEGYKLQHYRKPNQKLKYKIRKIGKNRKRNKPKKSSKKDLKKKAKRETQKVKAKDKKKKNKENKKKDKKKSIGKNKNKKK